VQRVRTFSHALGTVRMGTDPGDGAARRRTAGCAGRTTCYVVGRQRPAHRRRRNPSLTIAAHALRAGERIACRLRSRPREHGGLTAMPRRPRTSSSWAAAPAAAAHSRTARADARARAPVLREPHRPAKAAAFERRFRGAGSYGTYEAALADGRTDVAFVATPPSSHLELTLAALARGQST
jgi:hypothetical protein